jgi:hypothetical protein
LPPGRAKLATNPLLIESPLVWNTTGIVTVACFARIHRAVAAFGHDQIDVARDELSRQTRQPSKIGGGPAIFDRDVAALDVAGFG